jgi:hypothetical protein
MELKTIIEKETGKEIGATYSNECLETEILIKELRTNPMENPYFNFETREFYEGSIII